MVIFHPFCLCNEVGIIQLKPSFKTGWLKSLSDLKLGMIYNYLYTYLYYVCICILYHMYLYYICICYILHISYHIYIIYTHIMLL